MTIPVTGGGRPKGRPRAVTVPNSFFGLNAPVIESPCRLAGWSLLALFGNSDGIEASIQGVAAATATLTMTNFAAVSSVTVTPAAAWPAGANVVTVNNVQGGPIIAQIEGGTENPVLITFNPPSGVTGTPTAVVPAMAGGPAYTIDATGIGPGSAGPLDTASASIMDGGQVIGMVGIVQGESDTHMLGDDGIYVGTSIALSVTAGELAGVIYVIDDWHGGGN